MQQGTVTLEHALKVFLIDCQARRFTQPTLKFYGGRLGLFVEWCTGQGAIQLQELTATHIRAYLIELQNKNLSSAYVHSFGRAIRAWLNFCVRDELIAASPFARVAMPRLEKKILRALTTKEVKQILRYARLERDKALFLFLLDSGVRASELVALNVGDVDVDSGAVAVRMGKGQKGRNTYIGTRTRKQLLRYFLRERGGMPGPKEPLFLSRNDGARLTYWGVAQLVRRMGLMVGIKDCAAHTLRRTFAINCLRQGMNIHVLAKMMGHADIIVLRQYLDIVETDLQTAHEDAGPVDHLDDT